MVRSVRTLLADAGPFEALLGWYLLRAAAPPLTVAELEERWDPYYPYDGS